MNLNVNAYTKQLKDLPKVAVKQTRFAADLSADKLLDSKKVVTKAEKATLKLNKIAYGTVEKLITQQFTSVEGIVNASAKRLKAAAKAKDAKTLVEGQARLNDATVARVTKNLQNTVAILVDARDNVVDLFNSVYNTKPVAKKTAKVAKKVKAKAKPAKKTAKKAVKKVAKKIAKKPVKKTAKKATKKVAKKTARKTTRKTSRKRAA